MNRRFILLLLLTSFITVCTFAQNSPTTEPPQIATATLPPELARVLTDYESAWRNRDPSALANLFTEEGFVLSPGHPIVRGRAAIEKFYSGAGGMLILRAVSYAAAGDIGYIIGVFTARPDRPEQGKFTLTLRKSPTGRWLIVSDMDN